LSDPIHASRAGELGLKRRAATSEVAVGEATLLFLNRPDVVQVAVFYDGASDSEQGAGEEKAEKMHGRDGRCMQCLGVEAGFGQFTSRGKKMQRNYYC
jgi:hypothetical protein